MILLLANVVWHQRMQKYFKYYKQNDFIMQNYSVKKQETIFTVCIKITRKIKNRVYIFYLNIFKSYVIICNTVYLADKNKVNSIHLS
jgi:hypothetical protein